LGNVDERLAIIVRQIRIVKGYGCIFLLVVVTALVLYLLLFVTLGRVI
jgi:hypothetical protein